MKASATVCTARAPAPASVDPASYAPFLVITGHDYRTALQVNLHHCAEPLRRYGPVCFFSVGFSWLSWLTRDARLPLWSRSNGLETVGGIDCYLWRTTLHPFHVRHSALAGLSASWFAAYGRNPPPELRKLMAESRYIIIESGLGVVLFETVKRINPTARVVYFASDDLATIGCSPVLQDELARTIHRYDAIFSPSKQLVRQLATNVPSYYLPYGIDPAQLSGSEVSPYSTGINAVTAGHSAFDPAFFEIAAAAFPDITFHLIGCGRKAARINLPNVRKFAPMPFREVMRYFRHARFGIAAYATRNLAPYLVESSQKLNHLAMLGVPAVCPQAVAENMVGRFGYIPDNPASIVSAIDAALACGTFDRKPMMGWSEIVDRLLSPDAFADTQI